MLTVCAKALHPSISLAAGRSSRVVLFASPDLAEIGNLPQYIDRSHTVLAFCSKGYFQSKNCIIELRAAIVAGKRMVALVDPDESRGGLTEAQVNEQVLAVDARLDTWGLDAAPTGEVMRDALFVDRPIEWNRLADFQDVTLRLIAGRLLPSEPPRASRWTMSASRRSSGWMDGLHTTYVQGELLSQQKARLPPPRAGRAHHVYCDPSNTGVMILVQEVKQHLDLPVKLTSDANRLAECECVLVYLTAKTWTSGRVSTQRFKTLLLDAMAMNVRVVLAHEMFGIGQEGRHPCEFESFFSSPEGDTPKELIQAGLYSKVAVPLKGDAWRAVSLRLLARAFAELPLERPSGGVTRSALPSAAPPASEQRLSHSSSSGFLNLLPSLKLATARERRRSHQTSEACDSARGANKPSTTQHVRFDTTSQCVSGHEGWLPASRLDAAQRASRRQDLLQRISTTERKSTCSGSTEAPPRLSRYNSSCRSCAADAGVPSHSEAAQGPWQWPWTRRLSQEVPPEATELHPPPLQLPLPEFGVNNPHSMHQQI